MWREVAGAVGEAIQTGVLAYTGKPKSKEWPTEKKYEMAILGGGCFWCTEAVFRRLKGIKSVTPGYAGGSTADPTYEEVCSGATGHVEVSSVEFDPEIITYEQLLDVFMHTHNPTTPNQQGNDRGTQYRSIILTTSEKQAEQAEEAIQRFNDEKVFEAPAVTEVKPLEAFYPAEDYHQQYYERNQQAPYCQVIINPKLAKFRQHYASLLK